MFRSANDVISISEPEVITINGTTSDNDFYTKVMGVHCSFGIRYTTSMYFKDGKIRIDAPSLGVIVPADRKGGGFSLCAGGTGGIAGQYCFFNKKGEPRCNDGIDMIEKYINSMFNTIMSKIETGVTNEDW